MDDVDDLLKPAVRQIQRVKSMVGQRGMRHVDIPSPGMGVGVGIAFGDTDYTICSVMAGGMESTLILTSGVLKDIHRDRAVALEFANRFNQQSSYHTVYLHDAKAGWSLLVQTMVPLEVLVTVPQYFEQLVRTLPLSAADFREQLNRQTALDGRPWRWSNEDREELLARSMV